jgi:hypothetical protein
MKEPWRSMLTALVGLASLLGMSIGLRLLARDLTRRTGVRFNSRSALVNAYTVAWLAILAYPILALRWVFRPNKRGISLDWGEETGSGEERAIIEQNTGHYRSDKVGS